MTKSCLIAQEGSQNFWQMIFDNLIFSARIFWHLIFDNMIVLTIFYFVSRMQLLLTWMLWCISLFNIFREKWKFASVATNYTLGGIQGLFFSLVYIWILNSYLWLHWVLWGLVFVVVLSALLVLVVAVVVFEIFDPELNCPCTWKIIDLMLPVLQKLLPIWIIIWGT